MTSRECFVYITLPNQYEQVTAGKFVLDTNTRGDSVGRFVYGKSYLARSDAVEFDPVELKLTDKIYETATLKGVFGAIRDASPDYWGRGLIDRYFAGTVDEMEYLLQSPDDRSGALDFGLENLITGSGADLCFGGLFNLLSKKWTNEEFKERYTFVNPNKVMKVEAEPYDFYKDYNGEPYFKLDEFMSEIYGTATTKYFNNAMKLAGITLKAPYEYIHRDFELDYERIKNGEEKYFLRELFRERVGDLFVPRKYPLPRPLKIWANYYGEIINKDIFYEDAYERCTRDEEKWLTYSADHYLYLLRNRCFNKYHRIYTTGVYDMFHIGHLNILKRASKMCDELIVGVTSDDLVSYKGKQSIIAFADRVRLVRALPFVTKAVVQENMDKVAACKHYEINAIVVGDDWKNTEKWNNYEKQLKDIGVDVVYLPYTKRVSSTKLVEEIKHK